MRLPIVNRFATMSFLCVAALGLGVDAFFAAPRDPEARERWGKELSRQFTSLPEGVRVKVWDRQATVLRSDEAQLIGQRFPDNPPWRRGLS